MIESHNDRVLPKKIYPIYIEDSLIGARITSAAKRAGWTRSIVNRFARAIADYRKSISCNRFASSWGSGLL